MKRLMKWLAYALLLISIILLSFRTLAWLRETENPKDIAPHSGTYVPTKEGELFTIQSALPDKQAIIFLHGTGAWSGLWRDTLDALASSELRMVTVDMPPFGFSIRDSKGDYSRKRQAQRILALAKVYSETTNQHPILVAHSFGAAAGMEAVLSDPNAFAGLVIIDGAIGIGSDETGAKSLPFPLSNNFLAEVLVSSTGTNPLMTKLLLQQMIHQNDRALPKYVDILQQPLRLKGSTSAFVDWLPSLFVIEEDALSIHEESYTDLKIPTVIIWGDKDTITPLDQAKTLQSLITGSQLEIMSDVGHIPQIENPVAFQSILRRVLLDMTR